MIKIYYPKPHFSRLLFTKYFFATILLSGLSVYSLAGSIVSLNKNNTASPIIPSPFTAGAYMVLENMDNFPADDQLVFSLIQIPWRRTEPEETPYNANHDKVKLRIHSKGSESLIVNSLELSNSTAWKIVSVNNNVAPSFPMTIGAGAYAEVLIQFIANDAADRVAVFHDLLTISSNDQVSESKKVLLNGLYQRRGEGNYEPYAKEIIDAFNFTSKPGYDHDDGTIEGATIVPNSDEVAVSYFARADNTKPVTVYQMAAYHSCCASSENFEYFSKGTSSYTSLFTHNKLDGQSLSPRLSNSTTALATKTFEPSGIFGIRIQVSSSDRTHNPEQKIGLRFLKVKDSNGNIVPNAYLVDHDYLATEFTNYDYQDNMYYIENVRPETGTVYFSELSATTGSAVNFDPVATDASKTFQVTVKNQGKTYDDGSTDPNVKITKAEILGPNADEFSVGTLSTTLAAQATASVNVKFTPNSVGIKNAVLAISYSNTKSPLRIPLYATAYDNSSVIEAVKRIKGGSDANMTINGIEFESDKNYRTGSIKLDSQVTLSDVAGTDMDALYQTYLSAAANLAETGYNIPLANGDYMVRMHFVENYFPTVGSRVFSAVMEGQQIFSSMDIFNEVGYRTAIVKDFNTSVSGGVLNINFKPTVNRLAIGGLEIFKIADNPLPVTLIDFTAEKEGQTALLKWSTAAETNSKYFEIQHSTTGKDWNILGQEAAQGESKTDYQYTFTDINPVNGSNLYRLKMVDQDETFAYSRIVNLDFNILTDAAIYPNPVGDKLLIKVADWNKVSRVQVFSLTGKMVYESQIAPVAGIDVKHLSAGLYVVHVRSNDGSLVSYKMLKN